MRAPWCSAALAAATGAALAGATAFAVASFAVASSAAAQPPPADAVVARMHHTSWARADSLMLGGSRRVLRSPDGYLWLAHPLGLLRFDGVRFALLDGRQVPALRTVGAGGGGRAGDGGFTPRLVDRRGRLWIARPDGALVTYRDGRFAVAVAPERGAGSEIVEDGAGRLWIWARARLALARWHDDGRLEPAALPPGLPDSLVVGVVRDTGDGLWIGTREDGLWHVAAGRARRVRSPIAHHEDAVRPLLHARDGALWAVGAGLGPGLFRLVGERWMRVPVSDATPDETFARAAVEDADGTVWIAAGGAGLLRWRDGRVEQFSARHGLSDVNAHSVLRDVEGNTWVTTDAGLDRLRPAAHFTVATGDPRIAASRIVEDERGRAWLESDADARLYRVVGGLLHGVGPDVRLDPVRPGDTTRYQLLDAARGGGAWVAPYAGGLARLDERGLHRVGDAAGVPRRRIWRAAVARDGTLWTALLWGGVGRLRDGRWRAVPLAGAGGAADAQVASLAGDARGRMWVAMRGAAIVYELAGDSVARRLGEADGLPEPLVDLAPERGDTLWGIGARSLVRIAGGRVAVVPASSIAHLLRAAPALLVAGDRLWIASEAGIAHVPLAALHRIADGARAPLAAVVVTPLDGVPVPKTPSVTTQPMSRARDGRLWIVTPRGVMVADHRAPPRNVRPPEVHVEEVRVGGRPLPPDSAGAIPPRPDRVDLRFTATSLRVPERVRLEYRLDGADADWRAADATRTATYTQLRPGRYEFRVRAWNEDGVPAARETRLAVRVRPLWHETAWFATLAVLAVAATGAGGVLAVQRARERGRAARLRAGFEATLGERARVARELHDTLLQGFTGITLQLQAVQGSVERAPREAAAALARVLALADVTLRDARHTVWDLRAPELDAHDLADALAAAARDAVHDAGIALELVVRGERRRLAPTVETAALRIGREAVTNAVRHARPARVVVAVAYEPRLLRVEVRDDGAGLDPATASRAAGDGHLGLRGMHERATRAGGTLAIASETGRGTTVSLAIPLGAP